VLHTWNQKLGLHPHVHCVIPAGGLSLDHTHWVKSRDRFFLPIHVLRRVFRGKFVAALRQAFQEGQLNFHGDLTWIIHDFTGEKRKDALKGLMNTGFWRTRHSLSEHPRDDILLYTTAVFFLLPTPTHSS
jgi:hypothetical protein